jgi:hypothetical protein
MVDEPYVMRTGNLETKRAPTEKFFRVWSDDWRFKNCLQSSLSVTPHPSLDYAE